MKSRFCGYENVVRELSSLGSFLYRQNGGNAGDFLISRAEMSMFDDIGLDYKMIMSQSMRSLTSCRFNLVYGGGGGFAKFYSQLYKNPLENYFKNKNLLRCIVLPSSFYECDDVINTFDERFTVFCRDLRSLNYCRRINDKAKFLYNEDMALYIGLSNTSVEDIMRFKSSKYKRIRNMFSSIPVVDGRPSCGGLTLFREDVEKTIRQNSLNFDISASFIGNGEDVAKDEGRECADLFMCFIGMLEKVYTNRLHVMIGASLLNKNVEAYDNCYGKLYDVYSSSIMLSGDRNIIFHK